jgi:hypothetical protein
VFHSLLISRAVNDYAYDHVHGHDNVGVIVVVLVDVAVDGFWRIRVAPRPI